MSLFGFRRRRRVGRHAQSSPAAAGSSGVPGHLVPAVVARRSLSVQTSVRAPSPEVDPVASAAPQVSEPVVVPVSSYVPPLESVTPRVDVAPEPREVLGTALAGGDAAVDDLGNSPRVGLFFGDGTHVFIDASDPRAVAFTEIADELNH